MATITISKDKINGIGSFFDSLINSSNDLNAQFDSLKSTLAGVKSSTCDLSGTIETIRSSTATEEEKIEDVKRLKNKIEDFIDMAVDRDQKVADLINEKKEEFYSQYEYLKPECEKSTFEKFCDDMESVAEWCKEHWKFIVTVVVVAIAVVVLVVFAPVGGFLAGLCWGAIYGAVTGGVAGGVISMLSGGSFFEGFEEGAFSGMINGIVCAGLGSLGAMAGKSLNALYDGAACLSKAGQALSKTAKVLGFLDNSMDAFDTLALIDGLDGGGVIADLNNTLHGSTAYNIFQSGVSYASVFTGGAAGEITCFVAGTLVATKDGLVPIESLKEGDLILSKDEITGKIEFKPVMSTFSRKTDQLVHLTFEDEEIVASLNHPFFVDGHGFVPAGDLWIGANCVSDDGELLTLSTIYREDVKVNPVEVFNIKVDDYHTYFVSELGLWVHNTDCAKIIRDVDTSNGKLGNGGLDTNLLDELANSGVKYNPDDIVAIAKTTDGKLVWLENGTDTAGLNHIITAHADDFLNKGIKQEQIPDYVMGALENGKIVGHQGRGMGRPIYEFAYNEEIHKVAITVGSNGFVVGANPK